MNKFAKVILACAFLTIIVAASLAQSPYRVVKGGGFSTLYTQADMGNVEAVASCSLELYHTYPGTPYPPTFFNLKMKIDGVVVQETTIPLPPAPPLSANVIVYWEETLSSGHHVIEFIGTPYEQMFNFLSFRFHHTIEVDVP